MPFASPTRKPLFFGPPPVRIPPPGVSANGPMSGVETARRVVYAPAAVVFPVITRSMTACNSAMPTGLDT